MLKDNSKQTHETAADTETAQGQIRGRKRKADVTQQAIDKLNEQERQRLADLRNRVHELGRRTTGQVFDFGAYLEEAAELLPEKAFEGWVKRECEISTRHARNLRAVHRALGERQDECIDYNIPPSVLFKIAAADAKIIDTVIAAYGKGRRLKVREVAEMVAGDAGTDGEPLAPELRGGAKGLKALAAAKAARQQKSFEAGLQFIRTTFEEALEAAGQKRLSKKDLWTALELPGRLCHRELTELLCDIDAETISGTVSHSHHDLPEGPWTELHDLLGKLGSREHWPDAATLKAWAEDRLLPLLAFALDGTPIEPRAPEANADADAVYADAEEEDVADDEADDALENAEAEVVAADVGLEPGYAEKFSAADQIDAAAPAEDTSLDPLDDPTASDDDEHDRVAASDEASAAEALRTTSLAGLRPNRRASLTPPPMPTEMVRPQPGPAR
ncbi:hypothetical protein [Consotaella salsifontis]|uniref:Uncharacterized protein n=1 Tax=Consotaella salsifontis TaxID=1365950 RepID=A0A1T4SUA6_9HYPH|nr:hypothetical protein [Consotaella salsifontis]SKA31753.1 hypothetical protein SAMN05428963_11453 [Consotaella salsifontis]